MQHWHHLRCALCRWCMLDVVMGGVVSACIYLVFAAGVGLVGFGFGFLTDPVWLLRALMVLLKFMEQILVIRVLIVSVVDDDDADIVVVVAVDSRSEWRTVRIEHEEEEQPLYERRKAFNSWDDQSQSVNCSGRACYHTWSVTFRVFSHI